MQTVEMAYEVAGGQPVGRLGQRPVAAKIRYEKGSVMAVGFGEFFNDANMGYSWTADPEPETLRRYDTLFALLRSLMDDEAVGAPRVREPVEEPSGGPDGSGEESASDQ